MSSTAAPFKRCPKCGQEWPTRDDLLADSQLSFAGYQAFIHDGVLGLFLFNHEPCATTLSISARHFADVRGRSVYEHRQLPPAQRPSYCLSTGRGRDCPPQCECGFVADVVALITGDGVSSGRPVDS